MEQTKQEQQKAVLIPRCVSQDEMFNIINDKLDYLIALKSEEKK